MPYKLSPDGLSVLDDKGKVVKKHPNKAKAKMHLMALNMNVKETEKKRDYEKEYDDYQGKPDQIKKRASRNKARRIMKAKGLTSKGDGKDVDHKNGNPLDNSPQNLRVIPKSKNRAMNESHLSEAGARNSQVDKKRIQAAHDTMCELGAECKMQESRRGEATSYDFLKNQITDAIRKMLPVSGDGWCYVEELFDEYAIIETGPPNNYWKVPYTLSGEMVQLSPQLSWEKVIPQRTWLNVTEARKRKIEALKRWATENTLKQK